MSIGPPQASSIRTSRSEGKSRRSPAAARDAATADRDPTVARRPQVVEREPGIGDPFTAGPADLGESVPDGLGQHDVARPCHQASAERGPRRGPGVHRDDRRPRDDLAVPDRGRGADADGAVGTTTAAACWTVLAVAFQASGPGPPSSGPEAAEPTGPFAVELGHPRPLVDDHAPVERDTPQSAREQRRLDRRGPGHERPGPHDRGDRPVRDLCRRERHVPVSHPEACCGLDRVLPPPVLRGRGADRHRAGLRVPGIDAVGRAPATDLIDGRLHRPTGLEGARITVALDERREVVPPARDEPAVPPRGAAAADVSLDEDDPRVGRQLADPARGPQPRVPTAEHDDIRRRRPSERGRADGRVAGRAGRPFGSERLAQPPRSATRVRADTGEHALSSPTAAGRSGGGRRP